MDKFVLKRKNRNYKQVGNSRPKIAVYPNTYNKLVEWNFETGISFAQLVNLAVEFAEKHLEYDTPGETDDDEEE